MSVIFAILCKGARSTFTTISVSCSAASKSSYRIEKLGVGKEEEEEVLEKKSAGLCGIGLWSMAHYAW